MVGINPNFNWRSFGGETLQDVGYGLTKSPTLFGGLAAGVERSQDQQPYRDAFAAQQAKEAERQKAIADQAALRTKYADFFNTQGKPDVAKGIADGLLDPAQEYIRHITPKPAGEDFTLGEGDSRFNPDGTLKATNPKSTTPDGVNFDDTSGLRKEVYTLPSYKNYTQASPIYNAMVETAGRDSRASDLNLVYGLGKIMDPNSVVREGELFMVQGINTLPAKLVEGINSVLTGSSALSAETRRAILEEAYGRMQQYQSAFQQDAAMYNGIAGRHGIDPADVIPQFPNAQPWQPHSATDPLGIRN